MTTNGAGSFDGSDWENAFSNIQDGISAAAAYDTVLVSNGVYQTGGITNWPLGTLLTNRIAITTQYVIVRSANNDPTNTIIRGNWHTGTNNGATAVRCVYMTNRTTLIGFTIINGATLTAAESAMTEDGQGDGIYCPSGVAPVISNCVITGNTSDSSITVCYSCGVGDLYTNIALGNTTNNPMFVAHGSDYGANHVAGDYRLQSLSPCVKRKHGIARCSCAGQDQFSEGKRTFRLSLCPILLGRRKMADG